VSAVRTEETRGQSGGNGLDGPTTVKHSRNANRHQTRLRSVEGPTAAQARGEQAHDSQRRLRKDCGIRWKKTTDQRILGVTVVSKRQAIAAGQLSRGLLTVGHNDYPRISGHGDGFITDDKFYIREESKESF